MIFDEVARVMNSDTTRRMSRRTGLSKDKVLRMANGQPFNLDYNVVFALQRLGYEFKVVKKLSHEKDT